MDRPAVPLETAQPLVLPEEAVHEDFHRGLKERHIQMIAIGGATGVGLFLGSAKAIQQAGDHLRARRRSLRAGAAGRRLVIALAGEEA